MDTLTTQNFIRRMHEMHLPQTMDTELDMLHANEQKEHTLTNARLVMAQHAFVCLGAYTVRQYDCNDHLLMLAI